MRWIEALFEPKMQMDVNKKTFTNKMLLALVLPLFGEQFFVMLVGIADTLMVSYAGEEAVSGVSLVNMFITIFLFIFTALASGGAVIVSQYIGNKDAAKGQRAAGQLVGITGLLSILFMVLIILFEYPILKLLFGTVEDQVMEASVVYLTITAYSLPAIGIYNAGAALYRSMGKTKAIMYISLLMNVINVVGNAIGVFALKAGVAGVAWPSLIARVFSAVVIMSLCLNQKNEIFVTLKSIFSAEKAMIKRILSIAIPNSIEGGIFQLAKVALGTIVALFGTKQIAANGIAQSFWSMAALVGVAMGPAFITVIGQSMGAKAPDVARYYMIKLLMISFFSSVLWNGFIMVITPLVLVLYDLDGETKQMILILVAIHNLFNALVYPVASPFANGLRAAGDVKYTMMVAVLSTVVGRVVLSIVFGLWFNLGVIGIAMAMVVDWSIRAVFFYRRYRSDKWLEFQLI